MVLRRRAPECISTLPVRINNYIFPRFSTDSGRDGPQGTEEVRGGGVPERLRQDQHGHDATVFAGLQGGVRGRRHRVDAVRRGRAAARHQPGVRFLRRGPGHVQGHEPDRHGHGVREHDIHQRGADQRRRRLLGRHGRPGAGRDRRRLAGRAVDPGHLETGRASQLQVRVVAAFTISDR